jgi:hypothetical protein
MQKMKPGEVLDRNVLRRAVDDARNHEGHASVNDPLQAHLLLAELERLDQAGIVKFSVKHDDFGGECRLHSVFWTYTSSLRRLEYCSEILYMDCTFGTTKYVIHT